MVKIKAKKARKTNGCSLLPAGSKLTTLAQISLNTNAIQYDIIK